MERYSFRKVFLLLNYAFLQNVHTRKLSEITVFYVVCHRNYQPISGQFPILYLLKTGRIKYEH